LVGAAVTNIRTLGEWKSKRRVYEAARVAEQLLVAMRHAQQGRAAPVLFSTDELGRMVEVSMSKVIPALAQLEREGRVSYDGLTGRYSLMPMPWHMPSARLF
jgi:DNA-binding IclR family transcriptional regulator